ncbi:hypothetical protein BH18ACT4_BH18ACT4_12400 [soil metagenome]
MTDRAVRTAWTVVGIVALVLGALALAANRGWIEPDQLGVLYRRARLGVVERAALWLPLAAVAALIVEALGLWLLWRLLVRRVPRPAGVEFPGSRRGNTTLATSAIERAVAADLRALPGVRASRAVLRSIGEPTRLDTSVTIDPGRTDTAAARDAVERVYARAASVLDVGELDGRVELRVGPGTVSRVR